MNIAFKIWRSFSENIKPNKALLPLYKTIVITICRISFRDDAERAHAQYIDR